VWELLDESARRAVEVAERFADGAAGIEELQAVCEEVWQVLCEAGLAADPNPTYAADARLSAADAACRAADHPALAITGPVRQQYPESVLPAAQAAGCAGVGDVRPDPTTPDRFGLHFTRERGEQCGLIRCVLGNPFRPATIASSWLTPTVLALAVGIDADRAFDRLPILADALQDAECDNADILAHCRGPGPHVRGCWVVDMVLGKK
jgi:hypothetical protein